MTTYNYAITEVEFDAANNHITKLKIYPLTKNDSGNYSCGIGEIASRNKVISLMSKGSKFITLLNVGGKLEFGDEVETLTVTRHYIKTKGDKSEKDNLDNLPRIK